MRVCAIWTAVDSVVLTGAVTCGVGKVAVTTGDASGVAEGVSEATDGIVGCGTAGSTTFVLPHDLKKMIARTSSSNGVMRFTS
jgi:hypothetical protein